MTFVTGIDVSVWQDDNSTPQMMDFRKSVAGGVKFVFIKASQANWVDSDMLKNWCNAKVAGLPRGAYHYMTWDVSAVTQARTLLGVVHDDPPELGVVIDYEKRSGAPADHGTCRQMLKDMIEYIRENSSHKVLIYTGPYFWYEFGSTDAYWAQFPLWIAHYTTASSPSVPKPWERWTFWQYTDKGPGKELGAESYGLDMNRFNGTLSELYVWAGATEPPEVPPASLPEYAIVKPEGDILRVRTSPWGSIVGTVPQGSCLKVFEQRKDIHGSVWYRVGLSRWVSGKYVEAI